MLRVTNNECLVTHVFQCMVDDVIAMLTNGGSQFFNKACMLRISSLCAHLNKYLMAIILSLNDVDDIPLVHVTMDTTGW